MDNPKVVDVQGSLVFKYADGVSYEFTFCRPPKTLKIDLTREYDDDPLSSYITPVIQTFTMSGLFYPNYETVYQLRKL